MHNKISVNNGTRKTKKEISKYQPSDHGDLPISGILCTPPILYVNNNPNGVLKFIHCDFY